MQSATCKASGSFNPSQTQCLRQGLSPSGRDKIHDMGCSPFKGSPASGDKIVAGVSGRGWQSQVNMRINPAWDHVLPCGIQYFTSRIIVRIEIPCGNYFPILYEELFLPGRFCTDKRPVPDKNAMTVVFHR